MRLEKKQAKWTFASKVADFYEDEVGAMVKALTSMLEPAMIVVVGGIVGSILLAMYLPMFTLFDQIQQSNPIYSLQNIRV